MGVSAYCSPEKRSSTRACSTRPRPVTVEKAAADRGNTRAPWPGRVREKGTSPVKLCNSPLSHRYTVVTSATPSRSVPPSVGSRPVTAGRARL